MVMSREARMSAQRQSRKLARILARARTHGLTLTLIAAYHTLHLYARACDISRLPLSRYRELLSRE